VALAREVMPELRAPGYARHGVPPTDG
jgi:hypothetical protein